jgi:signal transduction histidine kinase
MIGNPQPARRRMTPTELIDLLARHQTLGSAPRAELEWLAAHGTLRSLTPGDILSHKGQPVEGMFIVLSGHIAIYVDRGAGLKKVTEWRSGDVTGMLPYSRLTAPPGDSVAQEPTMLLEVHRDQLRDMIGQCYEVTAILVHTMLDRARLFASSDLHDQKMISLGNLSARLAHELNNPATAIERAAATLEDRIDDAENAALALGAARPDEGQLAAVRSLRDACLAKKIQGILSPIQQAEREERIADWLEDHGINSAIAGALGETTITIEALDDVAGALDGACLDAVLRWAAAGCSVRVLASEIQDAASRISGLVAGVKGFTHMDQGGPAAPVDLATSLTNTIVVFRAKAREKSVAIVLNVDPDLPQAIGFAGEINQIFANLLDNALDAVSANGHIEVRAVRERGRVVVSIIDDGPGIPPEIRERIFEPLFTTKPVNKGTGLGLDIVRRLLNQNNAHIEVESVPGRTEFKVSLPAVESQVKGAPA